ncbi:hypothetical protein JMJ56_08155 [Belnapia sp. T18]|uniref:Uncharacterized protein n=1 Tax=Belnapia arida TaxID=2804533 RepID=A0ABS1TZW1_9PROT|nr:hypothetical protein [Belnapia arida]MBL6077974.1 hypothetical protein [Belnapia arida]
MRLVGDAAGDRDLRRDFRRIAHHRPRPHDAAALPMGMRRDAEGPAEMTEAEWRRRGHRRNGQG